MALIAQNSSAVGDVTDPSGAFVPQAQVTAIDQSTSLKRSVVADSSGRFTFANLPIGTYTFQATRDGFAPTIMRDVRLEVGQVVRVNLPLRLATQQEQVIVSENQLALDTETSDLGHVINNTIINSLPLNGRDFTKLTLLAPGAQANVEGNLSGGVVINGQRSTSNRYLIDGADTTVGGGMFAYRTPGSGTVQGASGTGSALATVDAIEEFKVQTGNYSAEFGLVSGGTINIVTKSGTNQFHGALYDYLRNARLDANDYFLNQAGIEKPPFTYNNVGGMIGGPIIKNRTFFFATFEHMQEVFSRAVNGTTLGVGARNAADPSVAPLVRLFPLPTGSDDADGYTAPYVGVSPSSGRENDLSVRIDQQFSDKDRLTGRYTFSDSNALIGGSLGAFPLALQTIKARIQTFSLSETHIFKQNLLNTITLGFARNSGNIYAELHAGPDTDGIPIGADGQPVLPQVAILPVSLRGGSSPPQISHINDFSVREQVAYTRGKHDLRFGVDFRRIQDNLLNYANSAGLMLYLTVPDFIANRPFFFNNFVGNLHQGIRFSNFAPYVQDNWRVTPKLTVNFGLRYELNTVPTEANNRLRNIDQITDIAISTLGAFGADLYKGDHNNFAPRIGFAWSPTNTTVIRSGYGIFYETPTQLAGALFFNPGITAMNLVFGPPLGGAARFPIDPALLVATPSPDPPFTNSVVIDPSIRNAYSEAYNVNVQQSIGKATTVSAAFVGNRGKKLYRQRVLNLLAAGQVTPPNPNFPTGGITLIDNSANSDYKAFQASVKEQWGKRLEATFAYTYAHSKDDVSTTGGYGSVNSNVFPTNPDNLRADWGPSDFDLRHNIALSFTYQLPTERFRGVAGTALGGWSISGMLALHTGFPYTPLLGAGTVANGDPNLASGERPDIVPGVPLYIESNNGLPQVANPAAFECPGGGPISAGCPVNGIFGNAGRNMLRAPGFTQFDMSMAKDFRFTERMGLEFRADFFNIFNHPNFANPGATRTNVLTTPDFGKATAMANFNSTGLGQFFNSGGPRNIQFALRFRF
ncbi:MAG: TonB-dependent receptor domain-containing protein [Terriglobales bacterium]